MKRRKTNFEFTYGVDNNGRKYPKTVKITTTNKFGSTWTKTFNEESRDNCWGDWTIVHGCKLRIKQVVEYAIWVTEVWGERVLPY